MKMHFEKNQNGKKMSARSSRQLLVIERLCCEEISLFAIYTTWHVGFRLIFYASLICKNSMPNYSIPHNIGVHHSYYLVNLFSGRT